MTVVDLFTVQIVLSDAVNRGDEPLVPFSYGQADELMAETEENLSDLLPQGYLARIRRWDHADEPTQEDDDE